MKKEKDGQVQVSVRRPMKIKIIENMRMVRRSPEFGYTALPQRQKQIAGFPPTSNRTLALPKIHLSQTWQS